MWQCKYSFVVPGSYTIIFTVRGRRKAYFRFNEAAASGLAAVDLKSSVMQSTSGPMCGVSQRLL